MLISPSWQPAPGGGKNSIITLICPSAGRQALPLGVGFTATTKHTQERDKKLTVGLDHRHESNRQFMWMDVTMCTEEFQMQPLLLFPSFVWAFQWIFSIHCNFVKERKNRLLVWWDNYAKLFFQSIRVRCVIVGVVFEEKRRLFQNSNREQGQHGQKLTEVFAVSLCRKKKHEM